LGRGALSFIVFFEIRPGRMRIMHTVLVILGAILLIAGLVFMGQGSGYFPYPASSFMINATRWIYYGGAIAILGLLLIVIGRW
jgi:hypothetical protein